jgi:hypothetical protein
MSDKRAGSLLVLALGALLLMPFLLLSDLRWPMSSSGARPAAGDSVAR